MVRPSVKGIVALVTYIKPVRAETSKFTMLKLKYNQETY